MQKGWHAAGSAVNHSSSNCSASQLAAAAETAAGPAASSSNEQQAAARSSSSSSKQQRQAAAAAGSSSSRYEQQESANPSISSTGDGQQAGAVRPMKGCCKTQGLLQVDLLHCRPAQHVCRWREEDWVVICIQCRAMCSSLKFAVLYYILLCEACVMHCVAILYCATILFYHTMSLYSLHNCESVFCIMSPYGHCLSSLPQRIWAAL